MAMISALLMTVGAGGINGSYAIPTKYVKRWSFESTWFIFSLVTFVLAPWAYMLFCSQDVSHVIRFCSSIPSSSMMILALGGCLFGCGQIGFAWALERIGMGLAFVINISLSIVLGSFLPLFHHSSAGALVPAAVTSVGVLIILTGLFISYRAGQLRKGEQEKSTQKNSFYTYGVIAAVIAGLGSAGQNYTFSLTNEKLYHLAISGGLSKMVATTAVWPFFLFFAFIPYAIYMLVLNVKNKSFHEYVTAEKRYYSYSLLMMLGWYGSLILYSHAVMTIGKLGAVVVWPLFMSLIIMTSNFWGWCFGEWDGATPAVKRKAIRGLICFVFALPFFGYATYLLSI
jgi:L-rhamnose-H+ transport protein